MGLLTSQTTWAFICIMLLLTFGLFLGKLNGANITQILTVLIPFIWGYKGLKKWTSGNDDSNSTK